MEKIKSLNIDVEKSFFDKVHAYCKNNMISKKKLIIDAINLYFKNLNK